MDTTKVGHTKFINPKRRQHYKVSKNEISLIFDNFQTDTTFFVGLIYPHSKMGDQYMYRFRKFQKLFEKD